MKSPRDANESGPITRLRQVVDGSGLTMADIAGRSDMTTAGLWRILSGRSDPTLSKVARVLNAVDASWGDLDPPGPQ